MTPALKTTRLWLYPPHSRAFDIEAHVEWLNNPQVVQFSEQRHVQHTLKSQTAYIKSFDHFRSHIWEIASLIRGYDYPIGTITARRDLHNGTAEVGILMGNTNVWGQGCGTEAWRAVCDWLLKDNIQKIEAGAMSVNTGMIRIFQKTGMRIEGIRKNHFKHNGTFTDMVMYGRIK